ncbi:hypothetical protein NEOLI_001440 [Neolecta irregularis DAH-3]|uniref:Uncharacterized protein n=1 Tax=Neolecta irregularis (strain DAH-3) TaxID=1198029 RepID=A0A1U7LNV0_NEOID|nr:hypothetical protein NEOLI_001440 [Neolecta irregularis DAH-3]|eukprot:OLL24201.1 hypothetical protein NEOLI_001440 [Neolecta irregularis DAH-3]
MSLTVLAQLPLAKSPLMRFPQPVSLPHDYRPVPAARGYVPALDFTAVTTLRTRASVLVQRVRSRETQASEALVQWRAAARERDLAEARRIAPGYLDSTQRLLTPSRSN